MGNVANQTLPVKKKKRRGGLSTTGKQAILKNERTEQAWKLRLQGMSTRQIGKRLGCTHQTISNYLQETIQTNNIKTQEHLLLALERYETLLMQWLPKATDRQEKLETGETIVRKADIEAARYVLKIQERIDKINGLEKLMIQGDPENQIQVQHTLADIALTRIQRDKRDGNGN